MGPTFHFDVPALHFGEVSCGECALGSQHSVRGWCGAEMEHLNIRAFITRVPPPQPLQGVTSRAAGASGTLLLS